MTTPRSYVAFLRGINVGGKNLIRMPELAAAFSDAGYGDVRTHLQSGNVLFTAKPTRSGALEDAIEPALEKRFGIPILVVIRSREELARTIAGAPAGHGSNDLRSEVIFLKRPLTAKQAMAEMPELREGVDEISAGPGALYFSRVRARATKTRIQAFMAMPIFQQMSMRSWSTTTRLLELLDG
jgi:uncharacterized protein (DUF1697 family)